MVILPIQSVCVQHNDRYRRQIAYSEGFCKGIDDLICLEVIVNEDLPTMIWAGLFGVVVRLSCWPSSALRCGAQCAFHSAGNSTHCVA